MLLEQAMKERQMVSGSTGFMDATPAKMCLRAERAHHVHARRRRGIAPLWIPIRVEPITPERRRAQIPVHREIWHVVVHGRRELPDHAFPGPRGGLEQEVCALSTIHHPRVL